MNCMTEIHSNNCFCGGSYSSQLWSKKKKIEVLEHYIECIDEKKKDIQETIKELKDEK